MPTGPRPVSAKAKVSRFRPLRQLVFAAHDVFGADQLARTVGVVGMEVEKKEILDVQGLDPHGGEDFVHRLALPLDRLVDLVMDCRELQDRVRADPLVKPRVNDDEALRVLNDVGGAGNVALVPDLVAAAAAENLTATVGERIYPENWEQGVIRAMQWMQAHSAAVRHVYRSEYYGEIKRNLSPWLDELLEKNIRRALEIYREISGHDLEVTEREFRMIRRYFSAVVFAFLEEWIASGMQDAPEEYVDTMSVLIHDDMYPMFDRIWQRHQAVSS